MARLKKPVSNTGSAKRSTSPLLNKLIKKMSKYTKSPIKKHGSTQTKKNSASTKSPRNKLIKKISKYRSPIKKKGSAKKSGLTNNRSSSTKLSKKPKPKFKSKSPFRFIKNKSITPPFGFRKKRSMTPQTRHISFVTPRPPLTRGPRRTGVDSGYTSGVSTPRTTGRNSGASTRANTPLSLSLSPSHSGRDSGGSSRANTPLSLSLPHSGRDSGVSSRANTPLSLPHSDRDSGVSSRANTPLSLPHSGRDSGVSSVVDTPRSPKGKEKMLSARKLDFSSHSPKKEKYDDDSVNKLTSRFSELSVTKKRKGEPLTSKDPPKYLKLAPPSQEKFLSPKPGKSNLGDITLMDMRIMADVYKDKTQSEIHKFITAQCKNKNDNECKYNTELLTKIVYYYYRK